MKQLWMAAWLAAVSFGAFAGTAQTVQFSGLVRQDNGAPVRFDVQVPATRHVTLLLGDGSRLEFFTAGSPGHPRTAQVRLVSAHGATLHKATFPASLASRSLDYLVCQGRVTYLSPAPAKLPACGRH